MKLCLVLLLPLVLAAVDKRDWTKAYMQIPNAARAAENEQIFTSAPHVAGSKEDFELAMFVRTRFAESGLRTSVFTSAPLLTLPGTRSIVMSKPVALSLALKEDFIPQDPSSGDDRIVPSFNAYSANGSVTAPVVYANYGRPEDYAAMPPGFAKGKIVLVRYGALFRGIKVRIAQQNGAVGVIIYSDPYDDGFVKGPVFPDGPWRPATSVQRGSAQFLSICPGDPVTPECGGTLKDHIPSVPVQPISYADATLLLLNLGGPPAPPSFVGGLNLTYRLGGDNVVTLTVESIFESSDIWSVCAQLDGVLNSSFVLMGNHRDAWTFGGTDPNSGTSTLLEIVRAFGELSKAGFVPQRSIRFCSWDGEEYGLLGSTAYALSHKDELQSQCIAYLNTDVGVGGTFIDASISPSLKRTFQGVLKRVIDPTTQRPLSELYDFYANASVLGSGSDYTAFLDYLGIPCLDFGFANPSVIGPYHSTYDDLFWVQHFGADKGTFDYYVTLAQVLGLGAMELANNLQALSPPDVANDLQNYYQTLLLLIKQTGTTLDTSALAAAIDLFSQAAQNTVSDEKLLLLERQFIDPSGLPLRPFYRHLLQAPGINLGYGSIVFPGVSEAVQAGNIATATIELARLAQVIENAGNFLLQ